MPAMAGRPFTFELSFDTPHAAAAAVRADDQRTPRHSDEELAKVRADALAEGRAAGHAAAQQEREQRAAESLHRLGQRLAALDKAQAAAAINAERNALQLAAMLVRRIAPHLLEQSPAGRIEALARDMLPKIHDEPRIVIRIADDLVDLVKPKIDSIARNSAFEGRIIYLGQPDMRPGDCLIEWADGGVETHGETFLAEIDVAVSRFLSSPALSPVADAGPQPAATETH